MEVSEHIAALDRDGRLLAAAAQQAGPAAAVPSCPPWQVRDLLRHIGYVHRWAARYIIERRAERIPDRPGEPELLRSGPDDAGLVDWYREGHARLVDALVAADPDLACYYFLDAPSPRAFWARRQAHETAVHRVDAELAAGGPITPVEAGFGADGVDELIMGFFGRDAGQLTDAQREGGQRTLAVRATDTGAAWHLALTEDGKLATSVARGLADSDCTLAGPAAGLYLLLWNRADVAAAQVAVSGDESVLASWPDGMRVTWE
jgi:uncharacterized protein (TIGR03083 family)